MRQGSQEQEDHKCDRDQMTRWGLPHVLARLYLEHEHFSHALHDIGESILTEGLQVRL